MPATRKSKAASQKKSTTRSASARQASKGRQTVASKSKTKPAPKVTNKKAAVKSKSTTKTKAQPKVTKPVSKAAEKLKQKIDKAAKATKTTTKKTTSRSTTRGKKKSISPEVQPIKKVKKEEKKKEEPETKMKTQINKGGAIIDEYCPIKNSAHVLMEGNKSYSTMLNQSNLNRNNNKFYVIQLLQHDTNKSQYYNFNRWGRVGVPGQQALKGPYDIFTAKGEYNKKIHDKTCKGEYTIIEIAQGDDDEVVAEKPKKSKPTKQVACKLDSRLQNLISLIFDMKMINNQMKEIGYDAKKMPLGKLADSTILKGYDVLNELFDAIQANKGSQVYNNLSGRFFSLIPHDFGFKHMSLFVINTAKQVREKYDMLQSLSDMKIATKILSANTEDDSNELDKNYKSLKCNLQPLDKSDKEYKMIEEYVSNTKGHYNGLKILDIFRVENQASNKKYDPSYGNKFLLWHGSRVGNFVGILSSGFRIMPNAGGLFGKGLYFADMLEKSAGYCSQENGVSLALLGEVAMGKINEKKTFDCQAHNLPKGKESVLGCASNAPPMKGIWNKDVHYASGKPQKFIGNIGHNEYLVYQEKQATMRFLIKFTKGQGCFW